MRFLKIFFLLQTILILSHVSCSHELHLSSYLNFKNIIRTITPGLVNLNLNYVENNVIKPLVKKSFTDENDIDFYHKFYLNTSMVVGSGLLYAIGQPYAIVGFLYMQNKKNFDPNKNHSSEKQKIFSKRFFKNMAVTYALAGLSYVCQDQIINTTKNILVSIRSHTLFLLEFYYRSHLEYPFSIILNRENLTAGLRIGGLFLWSFDYLLDPALRHVFNRFLVKDNDSIAIYTLKNLLYFCSSMGFRKISNQKYALYLSIFRKCQVHHDWFKKTMLNNLYDGMIFNKNALYGEFVSRFLVPWFSRKTSLKNLIRTFWLNVEGEENDNIADFICAAGLFWVAYFLIKPFYVEAYLLHDKPLFAENSKRVFDDLFNKYYKK